MWCLLLRISYLNDEVINQSKIVGLEKFEVLDLRLRL